MSILREAMIAIALNGSARSQLMVVPRRKYQSLRRAVRESCRTFDMRFHGERGAFLFLGLRVTAGNVEQIEIR